MRCPGLWTQLDCYTKNLIQILLSSPTPGSCNWQADSNIVSRRYLTATKSPHYVTNPGSILNWLTKIIVVGADIPKICSFQQSLLLCDTIHLRHHPHNTGCSCKYLIRTLIERKDTKNAGSSAFTATRPLLCRDGFGFIHSLCAGLTWSERGPISSNNGRSLGPYQQIFQTQLTNIKQPLWWNMKVQLLISQRSLVVVHERGKYKSSGILQTKCFNCCWQGELQLTSLSEIYVDVYGNFMWNTEAVSILVSEHLMF